MKEKSERNRVGGSDGGRVNEWIRNEWIMNYEQMNACNNEWMNEWTNEPINERMKMDVNKWIE